MDFDFQYVDQESVVNRNYFEGIKEMVICVICAGILVEPQQCRSCENSYCSNCIKIWTKKSSTCPFKCSNFETKDATRTLKNLLDKLILKCPNKCDSNEEFNYENCVRHIQTSCQKLKTNCPCCESYVLKTQIKETEVIRDLKYEIIRLETENSNLKNKNRELSLEIKNLEQNISSKSSETLKRKQLEEENQGLIDKCPHFKGNYNPVFACCDEAYPCYLCHNEKQNHTFQFSNKVVCLKCSEIYMGSTCPGCQTIQMYRKK
jgi:hypothetical protein